jgi:hypothetical protein
VVCGFVYFAETGKLATTSAGCGLALYLASAQPVRRGRVFVSRALVALYCRSFCHGDIDPSSSRAVSSRWRLVLTTTALAASFANRMAAGTLKFGENLYQRSATNRATQAARFFRFLLVVLVGHA